MGGQSTAVWYMSSTPPQRNEKPEAAGDDSSKRTSAAPEPAHEGARTVGGCGPSNCLWSFTRGSDDDGAGDRGQSPPYPEELERVLPRTVRRLVAEVSQTPVANFRIYWRATSPPHDNQIAISSADDFSARSRMSLHSPRSNDLVIDYLGGLKASVPLVVVNPPSLCTHSKVPPDGRGISWNDPRLLPA